VTGKDPRLLHPSDSPGALQVLVRHRVEFVVIGGLAGTLWGSSRITFDLDICYARDRANLERLADALREMGATLRGAPPDVPFRLDAQSLHRGDAFTFATGFGAVDILGTPAGSTGFDELARGATERDLDGRKVRVCALDDLIRMKRSAGRAKDRADVEILGALRDEIDEREARGERFD
jgi:hypothetical protein